MGSTSFLPDLPGSKQIPKIASKNKKKILKKENSMVTSVDNSLSNPKEPMRSI